MRPSPALGEETSMVREGGSVVFRTFRGGRVVVVFFRVPLGGVSEFMEKVPMSGTNRLRKNIL